MRFLKWALPGLVALALSGCADLQSFSANEFKLNQNKHQPERCDLKPQTGMCKAAFAKYYFNNNTKRCEQFIWGGCGGTVPFENLLSCQKSCE